MIDSHQTRLRRPLPWKSLGYLVVSYAIAAAFVSLFLGPPTPAGIISGLTLLGLIDYFRYRRRLRKGLVAAGQGE